MAIVIRDIRTFDELRAVEQLQKEVWGFDDLDVVSSAHLIAVQKNSGVLIGAFDGPVLVGFVYGFLGLEHGRLTMHSHMLAVKRDYRSHNIGYLLKLAQREHSLKLGIRWITWTYDPLQALNAHFNIVKLGVYADRYEVNFYGEETSSFLHQGIGTDRLWVTWPIASQRVVARIEGTSDASSLSAEEIAQVPALVVSSAESDSPAIGDRDAVEHSAAVLIEIPADINQLKQHDPQAARAWREATRRAFLDALGRGFVVEHFVRLKEAERVRCFYRLRRLEPAETPWLRGE
ncbi:MAG TPA: hypothetical protein VNM72_03720 [Blastocatellia bacterium]|nr:hypothetical protein [Blastocatellia bacterium]